MSTLNQHAALDGMAGRPRNWPPRRALGLLTGVILLVVSAGTIGAGAFAAVVSSAGTYIDLGAVGTYTTDRYGLATDSTNWRTTWLGWAGSVRLKVESTRQKPIFVGVAAPEVIGRYLSAAGYTTVAEDTGRGLVRTDHDGPAPAMPPATAVDWTAHSQGTGTQTLRWKATDGRQIVFAMNADASRPVRVRVLSSAITLDRMPWWAPAGALLLGLILLPIGVLMLRRTIRAREAV
jgi:hypothetical protein